LTNQDFLEPWLGGVVLGCYVIVLVAVGSWTSSRRDIT